MDLQLSGKRALVTGSNSGIGEGIARMLAREGCAVVVHGRNRARCEAVAAEIGALGVAVGDLSTNEGAEVVANAAGEVDILVNNAGGSEGTSTIPWLDCSEDEWLQTYQANTLAAVRLIRRLVPGMKERGWGRVINIGSAAGTRPTGLGAHYSAAKAAMNEMTVGLAKALGDSGVTANTISPGLIATPGGQRWLTALKGKMGWDDLTAEEAEKRASREYLGIAVGRMGVPDDIGHAVCMLASPGAGFISGCNLRVDGGMILTVN